MSFEKQCGGIGVLFLVSLFFWGWMIALTVAILSSVFLFCFNISNLKTAEEKMAEQRKKSQEIGINS